LLGDNGQILTSITTLSITLKQLEVGFG